VCARISETLGRRRDRAAVYQLLPRRGKDIDPSSQLAENGRKFKVEPSRLLSALRWLHGDEPPDLDLTLVRDPAICFKYVATKLLSALNRHDPHLFDSLPLRRRA